MDQDTPEYNNFQIKLHKQWLEFELESISNCNRILRNIDVTEEQANELFALSSMNPDNRPNYPYTWKNDQLDRIHAKHDTLDEPDEKIQAIINWSATCQKILRKLLRKHEKRTQFFNWWSTYDFDFGTQILDHPQFQKRLDKLKLSTGDPEQRLPTGFMRDVKQNFVKQYIEPLNDPQTFLRSILANPVLLNTIKERYEKQKTPLPQISLRDFDREQKTLFNKHIQLDVLNAQDECLQAWDDVKTHVYGTTTTTDDRKLKFMQDFQAAATRWAFLLQKTNLADDVGRIEPLYENGKPSTTFDLENVNEEFEKMKTTLKTKKIPAGTSTNLRTKIAALKTNIMNLTVTKDLPDVPLRTKQRAKLLAKAMQADDELCSAAQSLEL